MKKTTVIITGIAGLIGSKLGEMLANKPENIEVYGIDDLSGGYIENVDSKINFISKNLIDDLDGVFNEVNPDYVFHLAAYAAEGLSPFIRKFNYSNNLLSTANIVNECIKHNVKRLVFTSSMAVYGHGKPPFDEKDTPKPIDPYGIAKYACEMDIKVAGDQHGLDWCILRPHNVYGPNQNIWDMYRNVLGIWMYQYMNEMPLTIFGDGKQIRAFSYIDDCLDGIWRSAVQENCSKQIINLGGTKYYTINEANAILRQVLQGGEVAYKESRDEVFNAHPTWKKSVELLGYKDKTALPEGLAKMWEWASSQPQRKRFKWGKYEIEKGLYSFWK